MDLIEPIENIENGSADLNFDKMRKEMNPNSFRYDIYFDGRKEGDSLPGFDTPRIGYKLSNMKIDKPKSRKLF